VRSLISNFNWDCEVHKLFKKEHLDVQESIVSSINQFFFNENFGIILEDDCIPTTDFFEFVADAHNQSSTTEYLFISGNNFDKQEQRFPRFTKYCHIWGWATTKKVWELYDTNLYDLVTFRIIIKWFIGDSRFSVAEKIHWYSFFLKVKNKHIITWDYQLIYMMWKYNLFSIIPQCNLVSNVGFSSEATNSNNINSPQFTSEVGSYSSTNLCNLKHDPLYDSEISKQHYQISLLRSVFFFTKTLTRILIDKLRIIFKNIELK